MSVFRASHDLRGIAATTATLLCLGPAALVDAQPLYPSAFLVPHPEVVSGDPLVGDLDGDGILDLVISPALHSSALLSVRHGSHDGTFTEVQAIPYTAPGWGNGLLADVDADGGLDLMLPVNDGGARSADLYLNLGDGTFGAPARIPAGGRFAVGDVDGDGKLDLVAAASAPNAMTTRLGQGDGTFGSPVSSIALPGTPGVLAVADLDRDGNLDVLVSTEAAGQSQLHLFAGNGDTTYQPRRDYAWCVGGAHVATGDLDGDGRPDVAAACPNNEVWIHRSNDDGSLTPMPPVAVFRGAQSTLIADFDRDGTMDLAVASDSSGAWLTTFRGNGDFTFDVGARLGTNPGRGGMAAGYVDAGSTLDVVVNNSVLLGNGDGTFGNHRRLPTPADPVHLLALDVNHDARVDLLASGSGSTMSVQLGAGDGAFGAASQFPVGMPSVTRMARTDMNGDSHPDVVAVGYDASANSISVLLGTGSGTFSAPVVSSRAKYYAFWSLAIGDVSGDGVLDVVVGTARSAHSADVGTFEIWLGNGSGGFAYVREYGSSGGVVEDLHLKDMNGDGHLDIVAGLNGYPFHGRFHILLGAGNGTFATSGIYGSGGGPVAVADFDRDGHLDVIRASQLYRGTATGQLSSPSPSAGCSDVADFNGDGNLDCYSVAGAAVILALGDGAGGFPHRHGYGMGQNLIGALWSGAGPVRAERLDGNSIPDLVTGHRGGFLTVLLDASSLVDVPLAPPTPIGLGFAGRPNPARSRIVLEVEATRGSPLSVRIYDLAGRRVRTLGDPTPAVGRRAVVWDLADAEGRRVPAGVYLAVASDGDRVARGRMVVLD